MMERIGLLAVLATLLVLSDGQMLEIAPPGGRHTRPLDGSIVLTCKSVGMETSTVDTQLRWYDQDGQEVIESNGSPRKYIEKIGPQELKLYITRIENADAGEYSCTGIMEGSQHEEKVSLVIYKAITFDNVPSPQNPVIHTTDVIICEVSGQPAPEITWKYGPTTIIPGGRYSVKDNGLEIANITEDDNGVYICRAEVAVSGRFDQRPIHVDVHIPPTITTPPESELEGIEGHELSITCSGEGKPAPTYEFYKDDSNVPLSNSEDGRVHVNSGTGEVAFRPLVKADEGKYECKAINKAGHDTASGNVFVVVPPKVTELKNMTAVEGDKSTLRCVVNADPPSIMSFRKVGEEQDYDVGENDGGRIIVVDVEDNVLEMTINDLVPEDTSNYTCLASNRAGDDKQNGTIIVQFSPRFHEDHNDHIYSWAGKTRNMTCEVRGEPIPYLRWMRYGSEIRDNETYHIYRMDRTCNLQVTIQEQDQDWIYGDYTCHASNDIQPTAEQLVELIRARYPDPPDNVEVVEQLSTPTMVVLNVTAPSEDGGQPVIGYEVTWETMSQTFELDLEATAGTDDVVKIINLRGETNYIFYIKSFNEVGRSEAYELSHTTANIREPYPIKITSDKEGLYPHEYTLTWADPQDGGMPIKFYDFSWRRVSVKEGTFDLDEPLEDWTSNRINDDQGQPMRWYKLIGLNSNTYYEAEIIAHNDRGASSPHKEFIFLTHKGKDSQASTGAGGIGTGAVIGIVIAVFFIFLVIVDICCYFVNHCGVLSIICDRAHGGAGAKSSEKAMEEGDSKEIVMEQQPMAEEEKVPPEEGEEVQPEEQAPPPAVQEEQEDEKKPLSEEAQDAPEEDGKEPIDEKDELKKDEVVEEPDEKTPLASEEKEAPPADDKVAEEEEDLKKTIEDSADTPLTPSQQPAA